MLNRPKVRKYLRIRWDISFRKAFALKSEDEQIEELGEIGEFMHKLAWTPVPTDFNDETKEYYATGILEQIEKSFRNETT